MCILSKHFLLGLGLLIFFFLPFNISPATAQVSDNFHQCFAASTCSQCLQLPHCGWCLQSDFQAFGTSRCLDLRRSEHLQCESKHLYVAKNEVQSESDDLDKKSDSTTDESPQLLSPNRIKLRLRPNSEVRFNVTFKQPEKFPVDIYYLMDLTWSMKDHLDSLVKLADKIVDSMSNITTNFRLGFGSFIDKVAMPYSNMLPHKLKNPCKENFACVPAYGFRNHLSLTKSGDSIFKKTRNTSRFMLNVKQAKLSGNLDNAEGGFDAIMQVISCKKEIKWHKMARKIILFATDAIFHYAGDGKLGGIIKPNDGQCHLNEQGYYTESLTQDYPTLQQINNAIVGNQINVIFSVPKSAYHVYEELAHNLVGSVTGELAEDSKNIVELIGENYKRIVSTIELKDTSPKNIELKYFTNCLDKNGKQIESNLCQKVGVGQEITFEVRLGMKSCDHYVKQGMLNDHDSQPSKIKENFVIFPIGIEEYVEVELELLCQCQCEKDKNIDEKSKKCSKSGDFVCGECHCQNNHYGEKCQCDSKDLEKKENAELCLRNGRICSGRGVCECGKCICDRKKSPPESKVEHVIYGRHCEYDTFSCPFGSNGLICSGKGSCVNGQCACQDGWSGDICDCPLDKTLCIHPLSEKICSGNGECVCGKCKCNRHVNSTSEIYSGRFCNECLNCDESECFTHDACVACQAFNSGPLRNHCNEKNCRLNVTLITLAQASELNQTLTTSGGEESFQVGRKRCIMIDEDNCQYTFFYNLDIRTDEVFIQAVNEKSCQKTVLVMRIVAFIVGLVLMIGIILLLVWKGVTYYQDKRAYQEWLEYLQTRQFTAEGKNPLYQAPSTKYQNPLYLPNQSKTE